MISVIIFSIRLSCTILKTKLCKIKNELFDKLKIEFITKLKIEFITKFITKYITKFKNELLENPLLIILMLSLAIMILTLSLAVIVEESTKVIFVIIFFVTYVIFAITLCIVKQRVSKLLAFLRILHLYTASPVIAISSIYLLIFLNGTLKLDIPSLIISIAFFFSYSLFTFYVCYMNLDNKFLRLVLSIPIYLAILSFSSFVFGAYYYHCPIFVKTNFPKIDYTNTFDIIKSYTKVGFRFFYSYIDGVNYNKVTLCQYYFGKLLDVFMLGFIFNKLAAKKISTGEDLSREQG
ncbi:hypothetical protein LGL55_10420 [Clostridium tagluense]|uniref:hypothetical protein n=1 Tax=Clostridium tagluense TaxID=360422 RepID=UPI001CF4FE6B|nr:hypothetical protein [Clostridium tagluense]MCB2311646.1 hypothetical protein [Clostridium tagluense]MCB2316370.1 hypothetical protein [Clostridium tagluense]MCB2326239.1 hypothetical protein [Clostridium tagluense]MCB2330982.1 hypothetical protein [Clostridium tagluense]MCB2335824.1 hypothetical protein [Clostridium tagluense]